jgi:hypothetical protein
MTWVWLIATVTRGRVRSGGERKGSERADVDEETGPGQLPTGAQIRSAEGSGGWAAGHLTKR